MKILRLTACLLLVLALLCGCRPSGRATEDYRTHGFFAEIRFACGGVTVYAEVETALAEGRVMLSHVRLTAPPALAGIDLVREGEDVIMTRDGLRMTASGARGWWETADLLCTGGTLRYVCDTELEGLPLEYAEIVSADGSIVELFREAETGIPKRLCDGKRELTVIRFAAAGAREHT